MGIILNSMQAYTIQRWSNLTKSNTQVGLFVTFINFSHVSSTPSMIFVTVILCHPINNDTSPNVCQSAKIFLQVPNSQCIFGWQLSLEVKIRGLCNFSLHKLVNHFGSKLVSGTDT